MDTCQILAITIPALIGVLIVFVSKENEANHKRQKELDIEKQRNQHEIIMHYLRNAAKDILEREVKEIMDKKFPEKEKEIRGKLTEIENSISQMKADLGKKFLNEI